MSMVHLVKKKIKGKIYLYLEHREWINGRSQRAWSIYLGSETKIIERTNEVKEKIDLFSADWEIESFDFGLPVVLMKLLERLDLINIVDQATNKRAQGLSVGQYVAIAVLNRCIQPCSKQQIENWFQSTYLQNFFPPIETYLDSMAYVNHFEYLDDKAIDTIEANLVENLQKEFNVKFDRIMFDPTNFYTYINPVNQNLPRHGHSKENRATLNLVGISLFCTNDYGIPIMHNVYPGNIRDVTQFKTEFPRFIERFSDLQDQKISIDDITLVFDKGNISEDNFKLILESEIKWITSIRPSSQKELEDLTEDNFKSKMVTFSNGKEVGIREYFHELHNNKGRLFVVYNPKTQEWKARNLRKKIDKIVNELENWFLKPAQFKNEIRIRLNYKKWDNKKEVIKKVESLIGKKKYKQLINYEVKGDNGQLSLKIWKNEEKIKEQIKKLGKSYIMTNDKDMSAKDVVWMYRQQYTIENSFKYLKNPHTLSVRPMHHYKDSSIRGHILTCILGLMILRLLTREVNEKFKMKMSQNQILEHLKGIKIAKVMLEGRNEVKETVMKLSPEANDLYKKFNLGSVMNSEI